MVTNAMLATLSTPDFWLSFMAVVAIVGLLNTLLLGGDDDTE